MIQQDILTFQTPFVTVNLNILYLFKKTKITMSALASYPPWEMHYLDRVILFVLQGASHRGHTISIFWVFSVHRKIMIGVIR